VGPGEHTAYSVADGNARDSYSGLRLLMVGCREWQSLSKGPIAGRELFGVGAGGHFIAVIPALNVVVYTG